MKRSMKNADEYDVFTGWRHIYCWTQRAGACKKVKQRVNRRERREGKQAGRAAVSDWRSAMPDGD
jgi:hypothetical protein